MKYLSKYKSVRIPNRKDSELFIELAIPALVFANLLVFAITVIIVNVF